MSNIIIERDSKLYKTFVKRILDVVCALAALVTFCWLYAIIAVLVGIKHGRPILFKQLRPGKDEKLFYLYKFRTMTNEKDSSGQLLPDEKRLTRFGEMLRATSLDELPEAFNILIGDMSLIGPRPQLVKDMVFMNEEQRKRHIVRPGLSGLAQVNGRNAISWENKLSMDLQYIDNIMLLTDIKIVFETIIKFIRKEDINQEDMATAEDYGDYLLRMGKIDIKTYEVKNKEAQNIIEAWNEKN